MQATLSGSCHTSTPDAAPIRAPRSFRSHQGAAVHSSLHGSSYLSHPVSGEILHFYNLLFHRCLFFPQCTGSICLQKIRRARIPTGTGLLLLFYYATFSFASVASVANASLSFTASSASIFLFMSTFASFRPCMNLL